MLSEKIKIFSPVYFTIFYDIIDALRIMFGLRTIVNLRKFNIITTKLYLAGYIYIVLKCFVLVSYRQVQNSVGGRCIWPHLKYLLLLLLYREYGCFQSSRVVFLT